MFTRRAGLAAKFSSRFRMFTATVFPLRIGFARGGSLSYDATWRAMRMSARFCRGPLHRRDFLRIGGLALGGLALPDVLRARAAARRTADTSVIMVYCLGGASHLETYDLKPD